MDTLGFLPGNSTKKLVFWSTCSNYIFRLLSWLEKSNTFNIQLCNLKCNISGASGFIRRSQMCLRLLYLSHSRCRSLEPLMNILTLVFNVRSWSHRATALYWPTMIYTCTAHTKRQHHTYSQVLTLASILILTIGVARA